MFLFDFSLIKTIMKFVVKSDTAERRIINNTVMSHPFLKITTKRSEIAYNTNRLVIIEEDFNKYFKSKNKPINSPEINEKTIGGTIANTVHEISVS